MSVGSGEDLANGGWFAGWNGAWGADLVAVEEMTMQPPCRTKGAVDSCTTTSPGASRGYTCVVGIQPARVRRTLASDRAAVR